MEIELQDNSFDFQKLQNVGRAVAEKASTQSGIERASEPVPRRRPAVARGSRPGQSRDARRAARRRLPGAPDLPGSTYVNQFNRFGRTFQVYAQADHPYRVTPEEISRLYVRNANGDMVPLGTMIEVSYKRAFADQPLQPAPGGADHGHPGPELQLGSGALAARADRGRTLPPGMGYEWTGMSYQEKQVGNQAYFVFALALLLVYLALAAQYESWSAPVAVLLAVPIALLGTVAVLTPLGVANNLYMQIGLVLLIALASKNAILIVEFARDLRINQRRDILDAAVEAARLRFRPILMTSFAFILGVLPLVFATGAGANARRSIGITVASGMLASTCIAVLFVPAFFVVLQRLSERRAAHPAPQADPSRADAAEASLQSPGRGSQCRESLAEYLIISLTRSSRSG